MEEQKKISDGGSKYVIMVYGYELNKGSDAPFYQWLYKDYSNASPHGYYDGCPWVYVNLLNKSYFSAMPGIKITDILNDHAVTIAEFHTILSEYEKNPENFDQSETVKSIYKKYKGKDVLVFKKHRFDCDD